MTEVRDNKENNRFEFQIENLTAFVNYEFIMGKLAIQHTEVPQELKGKGIGSKMVSHILNMAKENGIKIYPFCPFTSGYIKKHPEWMEVVDKGFKWEKT